MLGKIAVLCAAIIAFNTFSHIREHKFQAKLATFSGEDTGEDVTEKVPEKVTPETYTVITTRNIFGVASTDGSKPGDDTPTVASKLSLRLVGTSIALDGSPFAIIEDTAKNEQDTFDLEDKIFGQATLIEINTENVKIKHGDKIETLSLQIDVEGGLEGDSGGVESDASGTSFTVSEDEVNQALSNLPQLLSQARAVPFFRNGQSVGMRLFAIRVGSLYEKIGLKNGDVLKAVNENSLSDPSQALKIFEQLKSERSINLKIERSGSEMDLKYSIE